MKQQKTSASEREERKALAWVSGVSGGKGERWKRKRERGEEEKRLTQMLLLEPSTPFLFSPSPLPHGKAGYSG